MAISKSEVAKLAATGGRGQLEARMRILQDVGGYIAQTPDAPAQGAAPAAPLPSNPPPAPPTLSAREQWRSDIDRLGRSGSLADQGRARQLVLQGEPAEPAPVAPPASK